MPSVGSLKKTCAECAFERGGGGGGGGGFWGGRVAGSGEWGSWVSHLSMINILKECKSNKFQSDIHFGLFYHNAILNYEKK